MSSEEKGSGNVSKGFPSAKDIVLENFTTMVIEEFLVRKGLKDTLNSFRAEWKRPTEVRIKLF